MCMHINQQTALKREDGRNDVAGRSDRGSVGDESGYDRRQCSPNYRHSSIQCSLMRRHKDEQSYDTSQLLQSFFTLSYSR